MLSVNIFAMSYALDLHEFRVAKKFIHDSVIADPNAVSAFRAGQLLRSMRQRFIRQFRDGSDNAGDVIARNAAQIFSG